MHCASRGRPIIAIALAGGIFSVAGHPAAGEVVCATLCDDEITYTYVRDNGKLRTTTAELDDKSEMDRFYCRGGTIPPQSCCVEAVQTTSCYTADACSPCGTAQLSYRPTYYTRDRHVTYRDSVYHPRRDRYTWYRDNDHYKDRYDDWHDDDRWGRWDD